MVVQDPVAHAHVPPEIGVDGGPLKVVRYGGEGCDCQHGKEREKLSGTPGESHPRQTIAKARRHSLTWLALAASGAHVTSYVGVRQVTFARAVSHRLPVRFFLDSPYFTAEAADCIRGGREWKKS